MRPSPLALLLGCAAFLCFATSALGDVVTLRDGRSLEGSVTVDGPFVVVRHRFGEARVPQGQVLRIEESEDRWDALRRLTAELGTGTADERYRLGVWAREHGFEREAQAAFLSVLRLDLDHPGARAALGYVRRDGRWLSADDAARLEGKVRYKNRWVTPQEKERLLAAARARREARRKAAEERKLAARRAREARREAEREARRERLLAYERELARERARRRVAAEYADERAGVIYGDGRSGVFLTPSASGGVVTGDCWAPIYGPRGIAGWRTRGGTCRTRTFGARLSGSYQGSRWGVRWRFGF